MNTRPSALRLSCRRERSEGARARSGSTTVAIALLLRFQADPTDPQAIPKFRALTVAFSATVQRAEVWRRANGSTPRRKPITGATLYLVIALGTLRRPLRRLLRRLRPRCRFGHHVDQHEVRHG